MANISKNGRNNEDFLPWKPLISTKRVKISNYILFIAVFCEIPLLFKVHNEYFEKIHNRASHQGLKIGSTTNPHKGASQRSLAPGPQDWKHNEPSHQSLKIGSTTNLHPRASQRRLATNPHPEPSPRSLPPQPYTLVNTFSPC